MKTTLTLTLPFDFEQNEIPVEVDYLIANDGIGHYEFWGASCYDAGVDYPEIDQVTPLFTDEPEQLRARIKDYLDVNFDTICQQLVEKIHLPEYEPEYDPEEGMDD